MASWVRYSVAAYLGFLFAGSIMWAPSTTAGSGSQASPNAIVDEVAKPQAAARIRIPDQSGQSTKPR